jgi:uncharacterized membrane protein YdjX (TVP38/TMEM64 family)
MRSRATKIALVALVASFLVIAWRLGAFAALRDPKHLAEELVALGAWGYVAFILAYATLQPFGIPGTVFVVAAPLIWPWPIAFVLSMIGTMAASSVGFSFARFVARDAIAPRIPARFRKYDEALAERAFTTVFVLRFVFWMPPLLHAFFGVSKVRFWTHFWGSFCGYLVPLFLMSFFGQRLFDFMKNAPLGAWIAVVAVVVIAVALYVRRALR